MKIYNLAEIEDYGEYYRVLSVFDSEYYDFNKRDHLRLNNMAAIKIKDGLRNNKIVKILKDIKIKNEVMIRHIIIEDKVEMNELETLKFIHLSNFRENVNHAQANVYGIQMYEYININNYLNDKGYFIHDDNKEETYLEILETSDEALIDKLEVYLNARDDISRASTLERFYAKFYNEMKEAESTEDVEKIVRYYKEEIERLTQKTIHTKETKSEEK